VPTAFKEENILSLVETEKTIQKLASASKYAEVKELLHKLLAEAKRADEIKFISRHFQKIEKLCPTAKNINVAFLRSYTMDLILPVMTAQMMPHNWIPSFYQGDFNVFHQEVYNADSGLYRHKPDFLIIAADGRDIAPRIYHSFLDMSPEEAEQEVNSSVLFYKNIVSTFRKHSSAAVLIHPLLPPEHAALGVIDAQNPFGQRHVLARINREVREFCASETGVFTLGLEECLERIGSRWYNQRMWYLAHMPLSWEAVLSVSDCYIRHIYAILGKTKKCLVLDLDNTLWGGIIGEAGLEGIRLGHDYPGNAFLDFQRKILNLYNRGIILAVNSKNDYEAAIEAIENHPHMLLRKKHFAAMRINWKDKVHNLIELSREINIGLDSMVFVDDSPFECGMVRKELPEVSVIELPKLSELYHTLLDESVFFSSVSFSEEDKKRGGLYQIRKQQQQLMEASNSLDDFFASLAMELSIKQNVEKLVPRISQMCKKTNQFNLTTIRHSENDISGFMRDNKKSVYALSLKDRFGDNGVIGVCIVFEECKTWKIDTMLISCRVIGRNVETAFMNFLVAKAQNENIEKIIGVFVQTAKNKVIKDFYQKHGFHPAQSGEEGYFELDVKNYEKIDASFIKIIAE